VIIVSNCNKHWKTKPKVHAKYVRLSFLLTMPSWIAGVNHSKLSVKRFGRFRETGFRFNKSIAVNWKILNQFRFGLANRWQPCISAFLQFSILAMRDVTWQLVKSSA